MLASSSITLATPPVDAIKSSGTAISQTNSDKVCGDKLCDDQNKQESILNVPTVLQQNFEPINPIEPNEDYIITHMEITQAIQNEENSVPLIDTKRTIVRVYVESNESLFDDSKTLQNNLNENQVNTENNLLQTSSFSAQQQSIIPTGDLPSEPINEPQSGDLVEPEGGKGDKWPNEEEYQEGTYDCSDFFDEADTIKFRYESWMGEKISEGVGRGTFDRLVGKYAHFENASILCHEKLGIQTIKEPFRSKYAQLGWVEGILGFPIGTSDIEEFEYARGMIQFFQGGIITHSEKYGTHYAPGPFDRLRSYYVSNTSYGHTGLPSSDIQKMEEWQDGFFLITHGDVNSDGIDEFGRICFHPELGVWRGGSSCELAITDSYHGDVRGLLHLVTKDGEILDTAFMQNSSTLEITDEDWKVDRERFHRALNFELPNSWQSYPEIYLIAEVNPILKDGTILKKESNYENNFYGPIKVEFISTRTMEVKVHHIESMPLCDETWMPPSNEEMFAELSDDIFPMKIEHSIGERIVIDYEPGADKNGLVLLERLAYEQCEESFIEGLKCTFSATLGAITGAGVGTVSGVITAADLWNNTDVFGSVDAMEMVLQQDI